MLGSLGAFLLYFTILRLANYQTAIYWSCPSSKLKTFREENDWDESVGQSALYQQATGKAVRGEAQELVRSIAYYERQGWDAAPLRARQEELRRLAGEERG